MTAAGRTGGRCLWRHVAVVIVTVAAVLVAVALPALAHASFVASQPEPGAELTATPGVVVLRFSEPLIDDLSHATVVAPTDREFTSRVAGEREIRVRLPTNAQGVYEVQWTTVSPLDGHTLRGQFRFGVGAAVGEQADPASTPTGPDLAIGIARAVEYAALLGMLGFVLLASLARGLGVDWRPRGLWRWASCALLAGAATVAGEVALASSGASLAAATGFLTARSGIPRLVRLVAEVAALAAALAYARRTAEESDRGAPGWLTCGAAVLALSSIAAAGHAAAVRPAVLGVASGAGHLVAAGLWAGAILVMAWQRPPGGWRGAIGRQLLATFSQVAVPAFVATVALGSVRGVQELGRLGDLFATAYGQVLTFKVALVLAMVPLSLRAWRRQRPRPRVEGALAAGAIAAAAVLVAFPVPPARTDDAARASDTQREAGALPERGDLTLAEGAGETVVGLSLRPGEPGINDVFVHLVPLDGEEEAAGVDTTLSVDGDAQQMDACGDPCRVTTSTLRGGERVEVTVDGPGGGTARFELPTLPAPDGGAIVERLVERMHDLDSLRYEEVLGPTDPPITSTWELVLPDRLHGVIDSGGDYRETIRIDDRRWSRDSPDGIWEGGEPGGVEVSVDRFIWDYDGKVATRVIGRDTVDGVRTRIVSFYVDVHGLAVWYRLWVDDDARVRQAEMRAQGHFMDHHYVDFDQPIEIQPPT